VGHPLQCSPILQRTYLKDKKATGKFSVSLGKKTGTECELEIGKEEDVLDAIQDATNRILKEGKEAEVFSMGKKEVSERFGENVLALLTPALKKKKVAKKEGKEEEEISLVFMDGLIVDTVAKEARVLKCLEWVDSIEIKRGNLASSVVGGKKAKKCEITIKFEVVCKESAELAVCKENLPEREKITSLLEKKIRIEEGAKLSELQETRAREEQEEQKKETLVDTSAEEEMVVDPFDVKGTIDYDKLIDNFGSQRLDPSLLERLQAFIGKNNAENGDNDVMHRFLRRQIFFSHRDFPKILTGLEQNKPTYLYTGRGPSSAAMHLGHLVPFLFTKWLQKTFKIPLVIQMTDDEKFLFKGQYTAEDGFNLDRYHALTYENAKDIIALGFDKDLTFLFSDLEYMHRMYPNILKIWKSCTTNTVQSLFGFTGTSNIGQVAFPAIQAAPSFSTSFPLVLDPEMACLIPCAIDQDPYFRLTRDVAHKMVKSNHPLQGKPALLHSTFFPPLQGSKGKMSSSDANSAIFLTDTPQEIAKKINQHAYSGGRETLKEQREKGADLDADVSYQWLKFFMEDDELLKKIGDDYGTGRGEYWSTGMVKGKLIEVVQEIVAEHQKKRREVTDDVVKEWMKERKLG